VLAATHPMGARTVERARGNRLGSGTEWGPPSAGRTVAAVDVGVQGDEGGGRGGRGWPEWQGASDQWQHGHHVFRRPVWQGRMAA
jgi:hypothetical protein